MSRNKLSQCGATLISLVLSAGLIAACAPQSRVLSSAMPESWQTIAAQGQPTARHEAGFVAHDGKLYLIGGRGIKPVDIFDPETGRWTSGAVPPLEMHHFQPVSHGDEIWIVGAMTGPYPNEKPLERVWRYVPGEDRFVAGMALPKDRLRGAGGVAIYGGRLWWAGGITNGHVGGTTGWLDSYDLETGAWQVHDDMPHPRDHFQLLARGNRLYAAGGRRSGADPANIFEPTEPQGDIFDIAHNGWLPTDPAFRMPVPRAGPMAAQWDGKLIYAGGESGAQKAAHRRVAAYDPITRSWSAMPMLAQGRHGTGLAIVGDTGFVASGAGNRGGGPELTDIESHSLPALRLPGQAMANHPVVFDFLGPETLSEDNQATFTDHRLMMRFAPLDGGDPVYVRGFFAADGDAADSSADEGRVWRLIFNPPAAGVWQWTARFSLGPDIAINPAFDAGRLHGFGETTGVLKVAANVAEGSGWTSRRFGPLRAVDGKFVLNDGRRWFKSGANSPENLLGFFGIDATYRIADNARDGESDSGGEIHRFASHLGDWQPGDAQWGAGRGRALAGVTNYLASRGVNAQYFLTWNVEGDGKDVWPHVTPDDYFRFDVSRLAQWGRLFDHMQAKGVALHIVLQETENELLMDGGDTGRARKFYMSELVARFAHHNGLMWNLGEENGPVHWRPEGQSTAQRKAMIDWMSAIDPYDRPLLLHTHAQADEKDDILVPLLGYPGLDGLSLQVADRSTVGAETRKWAKLSREAGRPWVLTMDEIGPWQDGAIPDAAAKDGHDNLLAQAMVAHLEAGGSGVEWYFGAHHPHNDLSAEDLRSRDLLFRKSAEIRRQWEARNAE